MSINIDHKKIREIAFGKRLPVATIIDKANISSASAYNILNGQQKTIYDRTAFSLAKALNCKIDDFTE